MKRFNYVLAIASLLLPLAVKAVTSTPSDNKPTDAKSAETDSQRITRLKTKGDAEIARRLTTLNNLKAKVDASTKLAASDKAALDAQIQGEISGLTSLKTKIDNDTDLATLRTDVQSIATEYRVYRLIVPKAALERAADGMDTAADKLTELLTKLQTKLDAAKTAGHDTTALQKSLDDAKAKVADAQAKYTQVLNSIRSVTPDQYNANPSVVTAARDLIKQGAADLKAARDDAKSVRNGLKTFK